MRKTITTLAAAAALAAFNAAPASAAGGTADTSYGNTVTVQEEERFPWGLLGLLGLLGLIPRKKKETVIDNRTRT